MSEYTPGPYRAWGPDPFGDYTIMQESGGLAVAAVVSNLRNVEEVGANARLFAAAPDLLEAAKEVLRAYEQDDAFSEDGFEALAKAIEKAEGKL